MAQRFFISFVAGLLLIQVSSAEANCLKAYRHWRNVEAWEVGLTPLAGAGTLFGSGMLAIGWEYGGWTTFKTALGPTLTQVAGTAVNFVIPTGVLFSTLAVEGVQISNLVQADRAFHLVKALDQEVPNSRSLNALIRRVQKRRPDLSREQLIEDLRNANESGQLCDGSWSKRKPASLKKMEKALLKLHANAQ